VIEGCDDSLLTTYGSLFSEEKILDADERR